MIHYHGGKAFAHLAKSARPLAGIGAAAALLCSTAIRRRSPRMQRALCPVYPHAKCILTTFPKVIINYDRERLRP